MFGEGFLTTTLGAGRRRKIVVESSMRGKQKADRVFEKAAER
jgi:hypothetical protein